MKEETMCMQRRWPQFCGVLLGGLLLLFVTVGWEAGWAAVPAPPASMGTDADPMVAAETLGGEATATVSLWIAVGVVLAAAIGLAVTLGRAISGRTSWGEPVIALFVGALAVIGTLYWLNMASTIFGGA
jgi:hypothetical protein